MPELQFKKLQGKILLNFASLLEFIAFLLFPNNKFDQKEVRAFLAGKILYDCPEFIEEGIFSFEEPSQVHGVPFKEKAQELAPDLHDELENLLQESGGITHLFNSSVLKDKGENLLRIASEGIVAGKILEIMIKMDRAGIENGASVNKAIHIILEIPKEDLITGFFDITGFPYNRKLIRAAWENYKPITFFWASFIACYSWPHLRGIANHLPMKTPYYFSIAQNFKDFGENYISRGRQEPILDKIKTCPIPENLMLPSFEFKILPLSENERKALNTYQAPVISKRK